ncbi:uncharacterized protein G2W53_043890 [Senna tora]|uniref:Uncharacterized protein n=1 Tax=Senna tora TaxID=362788 RepID=A0A834SWF6_9FABA|nr:uncharacterized protein G2W53_043890 [Senna tora]
MDVKEFDARSKGKGKGTEKVEGLCGSY